MDFYEVLDQIIDLLRQRGRVSYQALKRQFDVDDAYLEDLKLELIEVQELARDRDGKMLVWSGEAGRTPASTSVSATQELIFPSITVHAGPPIGCLKTPVFGRIPCPVFGPGISPCHAHDYRVLDSDEEAQKVGKAHRPF